MVRGTTGDEDDATAPANRGDILAQTTKSNTLIRNVKTSTHGVDDGLGLLKNLLLHEVIELALHNFLKLKLQSLDGTDRGGSISLASTVDIQLALMNVGNVVILQVKDLLGVLNDGGRVGTKEELRRNRHAVVGQEGPGLGAVKKALIRRGQAVLRTGLKVLQRHILGSLLSRQRAVLGVLYINKVHLHLAGSLDTDNERRTLAGGNDLVGVVNRLKKQSESSLKLCDDGLGKGRHVNVRVLVVDVLSEDSNALSVGLRLEVLALALQQNLQLLVVGDDTIMDNGKAVGGITPSRS